MVTLLLTAFLGTLFVLLILIVVTQKEQKRGRRFFAVRFRNWLDIKVEKTEQLLLRIGGHFVKYILQLHWYYGIHSILKAFLRMIVVLYNYIENIFERNRIRTKVLRAENTKE